jgi:hypothetical protein
LNTFADRPPRRQGGEGGLPPTARDSARFCRPPQPSASLGAACEGFYGRGVSFRHPEILPASAAPSQHRRHQCDLAGRRGGSGGPPPTARDSARFCRSKPFFLFLFASLAPLDSARFCRSKPFFLILLASLAPLDSASSAAASLSSSSCTLRSRPSILPASAAVEQQHSPSSSCSLRSRPEPPRFSGSHTCPPPTPPRPLTEHVAASLAATCTAPTPSPRP